MPVPEEPAAEHAVEAVVFDLGNVLIPWDRRFLYEQLIDDPDELQHFLDHVLTMEANAELDRGTPLSHVVADLIEQQPDHAELLQAFADRWIETIGPAIDTSVRLLQRLKSGQVPCYALSNWGRDTYRMAERRFPFLAWFDGRIISGFEGVVKPEPAIFQLLLDRFDLAAPKTLFIDDSAANIATAKGLGFATHHFVEPDALEAELISRGLLRPRS